MKNLISRSEIKLYLIGDTMEAVDPDALDQCVLVMATTAYIIADMNQTPKV